MTEQELPLPPSPEPEVSATALDQTIKEMLSLKLEIEALEAQTSELNKKFMRLQGKAADMLKALDRKSYTSPHGRVEARQRWAFKLPQTLEEKRKAFYHFKATGGETLLYEYATINANSYSSFCNAEWEEAKKKGEGMDYRSPHGTEATLSETAAFVKPK